MNILFLGGDKRYEYIMSDLDKKHSIYQIGFGNKYTAVELNTLNLSNFDIVLFPISGMNDNMEIKSLNETIQIPTSAFTNITTNTKFFTGLKTKKLLELIPENQIISFLDYPKVEEVNNVLTIDGTIDDIKNKKKDIICILGYRKTWKRTIFKIKKV